MFHSHFPVAAIPIVTRMAGGLGQCNTKTTSLTRHRIDPDTSPHPLYALLHNGQTHARAGSFIFTIKPLKDAEYFLVLLRFDANAVVFDEHSAVLLILFRPNPNMRDNPGRDVFEGIGQ